MKYYDQIQKRIIMTGNKADSVFWEQHWNAENFKRQVENGVYNRLIKKITCKFLKPGLKVLDGGCGVGQNVYGLESWHYEAYGVDFAKKTILLTKNLFPSLKVYFEDVRKMHFSDNFFDGYWSLGVIEHFWDGYDEVLKEARRIIKPNGFLFVTVPHLSYLRKIKIFFGYYPQSLFTKEPADFYQFILNDREVIKNAQKHGFKLMAKKSYGAVKGIKDEVVFLGNILQKIYDGQNVVSKFLRFFISLFFDRATGHMILLIFKKE